MVSTPSHHFIVYTDGGARGNPGPAAVGVVLYHGDELIHEFGKVISNTTNNVAEYTALIQAFRCIEKRGLEPATVEFRLDSELVVKQMLGLYRVKDENLKSLKVLVDDLMMALLRKGCQQITFKHVPRSENKKADRLVNQALDAYLGH